MLANAAELSARFECDPVRRSNCVFPEATLAASGSTIEHHSSKNAVNVSTLISSLSFICALHSRRVTGSNFAINR